MLQIGRYVFKRAETSEELEQVHQLNYRTFVREIPQYPDDGNGYLIDKFHDKNIYFVCLRSDRVVGMISCHDGPPFSVAERLSDPSILYRPGMRPMEVRLLAIEPAERHSTVFLGLLWALYEYTQDNGYTDLFISGVANRVSLYQHMGFAPLGPAVPSGRASFVPMRATLRHVEEKLHRAMSLWRKHLRRARVRRSAPGNGDADRSESPNGTAEDLVCLLPGPVTAAPAVRAAFHRPPIYHRGPEFITLFQKVRRQLSDLVGGKDVALFNGSGTLGNEAVAAALAAGQQPGPGIVLVNGEFGRRLLEQVARFNLQPRVLSWDWGLPWDLDEVEAALADEPAGSWIWGVHLESSTGVLNDLPGLVQRAAIRGIRVCADCISSLGAVPLDLRGVYLATGATGKSLGAYAGAAIVFADAAAFMNLDMSRVPSCLDIPAALATKGPRYTFPSPVVQAMDAALTEYAIPELAQARYERYAALGEHVRRRLREIGLESLADDAWACPVVTTFAPPGDDSSERFVARCRERGYVIGGQSGYLAERRLVQIATMGAVTREAIAGLFECLARWLTPAETLAG
ncbi:MAG TPA: aminotransferase class V-fold PLP-dependent enzyme [Gemmataceae bacterium]|nr:aminotransferase class V-fold PLP-dependent enzyme [Gemmataceae bacterium]